jgi:hypothetical protein
MYLGQLSKLREAFSACKITVTLDSRDQEALLDREGDTDVPSDSVTGTGSSSPSTSKNAALALPQWSHLIETIGASADRGQLSGYVDEFTVFTFY